MSHKNLTLMLLVVLNNYKLKILLFESEDKHVVGLSPTQTRV